MNERIRSQVNARLRQKNMTRADLAKELGVHQNLVTRALNDTGGRGGKIPAFWEEILDALDFELVVRPRAK